MKQESLNELESFLNENEMGGIPATTEQITEAEQILGVTFSEDYKEFISRFGTGYAGVEIYGIDGNNNVVTSTHWLRESHPEVKNTYVIGDDGSGNPFMIDKKGQVWIYLHDSGEQELEAPSLEEFIENNFEPW